TKETRTRARNAKRAGKSPSTQAGEFVREEIHHVREGKHGAQSPEQAIAIGLSKARRAGVNVPKPRTGSKRTKENAASAAAAGRTSPGKRPGAKRSRAVRGALKRAGRDAASPEALSRQGRSAARKRSAADRSRAAKKAARTKGAAGRSRAAKKAARSRARRRG
ncbi:MAG TPA: DUF6496 domain-containing protein, partial [Longimicrobiales bacterium]|nr:DUF6496 domain-containing protein [Longimicrobiales bacterium]